MIYFLMLYSPSIGKIVSLTGQSVFGEEVKTAVAVEKFLKFDQKTYWIHQSKPSKEISLIRVQKRV